MTSRVDEPLGEAFIPSEARKRPAFAVRNSGTSSWGQAREPGACKDFNLRQIEQALPRMACIMGSLYLKALLGSKAALTPPFHPAAAFYFYNEDLRPVMVEDMPRLRQLLDHSTARYPPGDRPTSPSSQDR